MRLHWRRAACFWRSDPAWHSKLFLAGLWLMVPVVGWLIILGYRRAAIEALWHDSAASVLPEWQGQWTAFLRDGLEAAGVIHAHFAPLYLWMGARAFTSPHADVTPWLVGLGVMLLFPGLSTLAVPASLFWLRRGAPETAIGDLEAAAIVGLYCAVVLYIPSGFLRVSQTGRITSAFRIRENLSFIRRRFALYCEAWFVSGLLSLAGHSLLPLAPWGVPWCYLGIVYTFNEVLAVSGEKETRASHFDASRNSRDG